MDIVGRVKSIVTLSGLPRFLQIGVYSLVGAGVGLAVLLARIANATSYLSDAPQTCINCHVMTDAYASWQRGSHGRVAVCIDCHAPHENLVAKYAYKARDGLKHSYIFTRRSEPQVLNLSAPAMPVIASNCLRCHSQQVMRVAAPLWRGHLALVLQSRQESLGPQAQGQDGLATQGRGTLATMAGERRCWDCHQNIHGKVRSLSASPIELRPGLPDAGLEWMKKKGDEK